MYMFHISIIVSASGGFMRLCLHSPGNLLLSTVFWTFDKKQLFLFLSNSLA